MKERDIKDRMKNAQSVQFVRAEEQLLATEKTTGSAKSLQTFTLSQGLGKEKRDDYCFWLASGTSEIGSEKFLLLVLLFIP